MPEAVKKFRYFVLLISILITLEAFSQKEKEVATWYDDAQTKRKEVYQTVNGIKHGDYNYYYETGELWQRGDYKNGELDGLWKIYYREGALKQKINYINGSREGLEMMR